MENEEIIDFNLISTDMLQEKYRKLYERYHQLREVSEEDAQQIHNLKRSLQTATAAEAYLTQELEQLMITPTASETAAYDKAQSELEDLRRKHNSLTTEYSLLQQDNELLMDENSMLRNKIAADATRKNHETTTADLEGTAKEQADRLNILENENLDLLQKLEFFQESVVRYTMAIAERDKNVEILRDQVKCLEENLRSKRNQLKEKTELLESTQEQLGDANAKIALLTSAPENNERKGNSLFAEVDDQRQAMRQLLAVQKKSYIQMKKIYGESQYEIRRLKRENTAMHTELQACRSIFCSADRTYQDKLNKRIQTLLNQNEDLERKLNWTQDRLKQLACEKGVLWLDSMLNFCKQETDELKKQLHSVRIQNATLEEQLRNVQQEMARWRFESLKSRCILLNREDLLNEHEIPFKPMNVLEFCITKAKLEAAKPLIMNAAVPIVNLSDTCDMMIKNKISFNLNNDNNKADLEVESSSLSTSAPKNMVNEKKNAKIDLESEFPLNSPTLATKIANKFIIDDDKENATPQNEETAVERIDLIVDTKQSASPSLLNEKNTISVKSFAPEESKPLKNTPPHALPGPPMLSKKRDVFGVESAKNVKFSAKAATIHNLSVDSNTGDGMIATESRSNKKLDVDADTKQPGKSTFKEISTKSNVIVRRIVINSKPNKG